MGIGAEGRKDREPVIKTSAPTVATPSLQEAVKSTQAPSGPDNDGKGPVGTAVLKDHAFSLDFLDKRGRRWGGGFKCHALTYKERIDIGLIRARLAGGISPHLLDITTSNFLEMLAHLSVAIDDAPKWARDMEKLHDPAVVAEIYKEVLAHEERFHGARPEDPSPEDDASSDASDGTGGPSQDG